jgi:hypothetical protein
MVKFLIKNEKLFSVGEIFAIVWKYRMHTNVCIPIAATVRSAGGEGREGVCHSDIHMYSTYVHVQDALDTPTEYTTQRVAIADFWRTFHHDGKISPGW